MKHSDTQPLSVEELMGLVYGEEKLPEERQKHLERCLLCQQELKTYAQMDGRLRTDLYRSFCPDAVQLHYYCLDMVSVEQRTNIASHLRDCLRCADEVAEIRQQQASFDPFPLDEVPLIPGIRRFIASLVTPRLQLATRDLASADSWPRHYRAENLDISLHLSRRETGEAILIGVLTSTSVEGSEGSFEGAPVELHVAPASSTAEHLASIELLHHFLASSIDDVGASVLEPIPSGEYVLLIRLPDREVLIQGITIPRL